MKMVRYVINQIFERRCGDKAVVAVDGDRVVITMGRNTMGKENMHKGKSMKVSMGRENILKVVMQKENSEGI